MRISNVVVGLAFALTSAGYFFTASALPASPSFGDPGPGHLPQIIAALTGITGVALAATGLRSKGDATAKPVVIPAKAILLAGLAILGTALMPVVHTPAALVIIIFGGVVIQLGRKGAALGAASAALITAAVYGLFRLLLDVPLP